MRCQWGGVLFSQIFLLLLWNHWTLKPKGLQRNWLGLVKNRFSGAVGPLKSWEFCAVNNLLKSNRASLAQILWKNFMLWRSHLGQASQAVHGVCFGFKVHRIFWPTPCSSVYEVNTMLVANLSLWYLWVKPSPPGLAISGHFHFRDNKCAQNYHAKYENIPSGKIVRLRT